MAYHRVWRFFWTKLTSPETLVVQTNSLKVAKRELKELREQVQKQEAEEGITYYVETCGE